jgi:hypothetical protein
LWLLIQPMSVALYPLLELGYVKLLPLWGGNDAAARRNDYVRAQRPD